jgi:hypothetical protein
MATSDDSRPPSADRTLKWWLVGAAFVVIAPAVIGLTLRMHFAIVGGTALFAGGVASHVLHWRFGGEKSEHQMLQMLILPVLIAFDILLPLLVLAVSLWWLMLRR